MPGPVLVVTARASVASLGPPQPELKAVDPPVLELDVERVV